MKIVIATDSYKGSLTSIQAANHIENGLLKVFPKAQITKIPIADGGEGADDILNHGIHSIANITEGPVTLEECIRDADKLLERSAFRLGFTLRAGLNLAKTLGSANEASFNESSY